MAEKKTLNAISINNEDVCLNDLSMVQDIILNENSMDYMRASSLNSTKESDISIVSSGGNIQFIALDKDLKSPYSNMLSEKEFFEIVGTVKKGLSKKSGKYQERLYGYYLQAVKENDVGFIADIFTKAIVFRNNLNYVKKLEANKAFMKEWRKDFGKETPTHNFKNFGNLRMINIIKERI